jgi:accessory gene regulator protein AgrB
MGFTPADILNLLALFISIAGSFLMFYFSPETISIKYLYRKEEMERIRKRDARKNKMVRRGMFLILIGCVLQASAIFLSVASK